MRYFEKYLIEYLNRVPLSQYTNKIEIKNGMSRMSRKQFIDAYRNQLFLFTAKEEEVLQAYASKADLFFSRYGFKQFKRVPWQFIGSVGLESDMPFTLGDFIIVSVKKVRKLVRMFEKGMIQDSFVNTMIHEKMHIFQRLFSKRFEMFYNKQYKQFIGRQLLFKDLPQSLQNKCMLNPDNNGTVWTYFIEGKEYYPVLEKSLFGFQTIGYEVGNINHSILLKSYQLEDHPNEIFAYNVVKNIKNSKENYIRFLNILNDELLYHRVSKITDA